MTTTAPDLFDLGYVRASGGWDIRQGFFLSRPGDFMLFTNKAEAVKAARSIGWQPATVERCYSRFMTRFYALHHPAGGFLTPAGMDAVRGQRAAEHLTRTFERSNGERYITKSNGSCGRWRRETTTGWTCTCGNGGFGAERDRSSAQQLAKQHREHPERYPGMPWAPTTVHTSSQEG